MLVRFQHRHSDVSGVVPASLLPHELAVNTADKRVFIGDANGVPIDYLGNLSGTTALASGSTTPRALSARFSDVANVKDFGAKGDGASDDTAAIQSAINSLSSGEVHFPAGNYRITSTLTVGNGSATQASTTWGIALIGTGIPPLPAPMIGGFPSTGGTRLQWVGGAANMINIAGPLNGWGVSNMYLDGGGTANYGIQVTSASFGCCNNLSFANINNSSVFETALANFVGFGLANSMHNSWTNLGIAVPAVAGAKAIVLTGQPAGKPTPSNSCYSNYTNVMISLPVTLATFGIYLQWTDSALFNGLHIFGGSTTSVNVLFDYTLANNLPSSCGFISADVSGNGTNKQFSVSGLPGLGARPNWIKGLGEINLGAEPHLPNLLPDLPVLVEKIDLTLVTAPITNSFFHTPYETGFFRASFYVRVTANGAAGTMTPRITVNDTVGTVNLDLPVISAVGGFGQGTLFFKAISGSPINYSLVFTGTTTAPTYSLALMLERIG